MVKCKLCQSKARHDFLFDENNVCSIIHHLRDIRNQITCQKPVNASARQPACSIHRHVQIGEWGKRDAGMTGHITAFAHSTLEDERIPA